VTDGAVAASSFDLDALDEAAFVAAVAPLFEGASSLLGRLAAARPFGSAEAMFERAEAIALAMPEADRIELLDAHPRLGAPPESVSAMSFIEQGYDRATAEVEAAEAERDRLRIADELARLNETYEALMGFRYCVFVAGRPRVELLPGFRSALGAQRDEELARGVRAVVDIARDRYRKASSA
jgi:2-oxo-4-hydroxy-4-carboxy-5-ureidoimidazoline decarboxylase